MSCESMEQTSLAPPSLDFPLIKFELDGDGNGGGGGGGGVDVEVQSPDNSIWDSLFTDHFESAADFMIMSPVRNLPPSPMQQGSPRTNYNNYNYNYAQAMQGQSLSGCSPPRSLSQLGAFSSSGGSSKGKGLSPLHKVFSSVNNQYMQQPENFALPAIEEFLDDYQRDGFGDYTSKMSGHVVGSSSQTGYDIPTTTVSNNVNSGGGSMLDCYCEASSAPGGSSGNASGIPLSQQLEQERQQEKNHQQQQHHNLNHNLMMPNIPIGFEPVN